MTDVERLWWCNSHGRRATWVDGMGRRCCDPKLGGILLPCRVVDLTDEVEIDLDSGGAKFEA